MGTQISIEVVHGNASVQPDDIERAENAALAVLKGQDIKLVYDEYIRQWLEYDDEAPMTGLALLWIDARNAADIALTEGWAKPGRASCEILA